MKPILFALTLFALAVCFFMACDDSLSEPPPIESDYDIYLREDSPDGEIFIFNTKELAIVDSFNMPYRASWPEISADGKYMLCGDSVLTIVDMQTREAILQLSIAGYYIEVSPDNRYFAIFHDSLQIYDASSFNKIYSDTGIYEGKFTADGKRLYCPKRGGGIYTLTLDEEPFTSGIINFPEGSIYALAPSINHKYLYLLVGAGYQKTAIQTYDIDLDSVISTTTIPYQKSYWFMDITPNGQYVIFADGEPNGSFLEYPPLPKLFIFLIQVPAL
jgi:hypothetical protein